MNPQSLPMPPAPRTFWRISPEWRQFWLGEAADWLFVFKTVLAAFIALWLAYRLEMQSPRTAVVTVFIVMQARTGMVVAKGFYRALGTLVGSGVSLLLVAAFAQDRGLFLAGLALWVGFLTAGATLYRNFQSYAFVLAGYTACIVGLPAALDPAHAFDIATTRLSEVMLGIGVASVVSGLVFPLSSRSLLLAAARQRFDSLMSATGRVIGFGIPRTEWGSLHLKAINDIMQLDSYRSFGLFEDQKTRAQNETVQQMSAELIAAASTLNLLNQHLLRVNRSAMNPVRDTLDPLLAIGVRILTAEPPAAPADRLELLAQWQQEITRQIPLISQTMTDQLNAKQRLALDATFLLLQQFLQELMRYGRHFLALQSAEHAALIEQPPSPRRPLAERQFWHKTDWLQPLIAALRTIIVLSIMSWFWVSTAWPKGEMALIIAVAISALFSTVPNPAKAAQQMGLGVALSIALAFGFGFMILPHLYGFLGLAVGLAPFLMLGAYLMTQPKWTGLGAGFGIFFSTLAIPGNQLQLFNYVGLVNNAITLLLAISLLIVAFFTLMPAGNRLSRHRMLHALDKQLLVACQHPLKGLRRSFERDTRELLRQVVGIPGLKAAHNTAALSRALTVQALGRIVIELRKLTQPVASVTLSEPQWLLISPNIKVTPKTRRRMPYWRAPALQGQPAPTQPGLLRDLPEYVAQWISAMAQLYQRPSRHYRLAARQALHQAEQYFPHDPEAADEPHNRQIQIYLYLAQNLMTRLPGQTPPSAPTKAAPADEPYEVPPDAARNSVL